ncbi:MAG: polysaccharide deacetylase family protein [Pseudomonadota bacterium]
MALSQDYTDYPLRRRGQDIDRYNWRIIQNRRPSAFDDGAALGIAIVVPLEYFMLNPSGAPFKHPGAMATAYPDLRHFTTRDYGNRVGVFRLLRAFKDTRIKATFAINGKLVDRVRPLIDAIEEDGHEIAAHGLDTDSIHWGGIDPEVEKRYVSDTRAAFDQAGISPRTWLSPARQQSFQTLDLIAQEGFDVCLDWEIDTVPVEMKTRTTNIQAFPLLNELDDRFILSTKNHTEADWRDQIIEAADMTASEAKRFGAQVFGFTMTPYIAGLPFRLWAVREVVQGLNARDAVRIDTVSNLTASLT